MQLPDVTSNPSFDFFPCYLALRRPCQGGSHVARLNFNMSHVGVLKCLSLIVGFAITVSIWLREVVSCRDFILRTVAIFWAMSLVGIYPGRASLSSCKYPQDGALMEGAPVSLRLVSEMTISSC